MGIGQKHRQIRQRKSHGRRQGTYTLPTIEFDVADDYADDDDQLIYCRGLVTVEDEPEQKCTQV